MLLSDKSTNLKRLDTACLGEIGREYADKANEINRQVELEIERHERERAIELIREREQREARFARETALSKEVARANQSVEHIRHNNATLSEKLKSRLESLKALDTSTTTAVIINGFVAELEAILSSIKIDSERVDQLRERLTLCADLQRLTDDQIDITSTEISSRTIDCMAKHDDLNVNIKTVEIKIQHYIESLLKVS